MCSSSYSIKLFKTNVPFFQLDCKIQFVIKLIEAMYFKTLKT